MKRRSVIKSILNLGLVNGAMNPFQKLFSAVVLGQIYDAKSPSRKAEEVRNFVQFNLYGAPFRFGFDNLLRPYDHHQFIPYVHVGNKVTASNTGRFHEVKISYETVKRKGLNLPDQWAQMLPTVDGKGRPMTDLLDNMLMIRGCRLIDQGHPACGMRQICPVPGGLSLTGVLADLSPTLFSSVAVGNNPVSQAFKSQKAMQTLIPHTEKNFVEYLMQPFLNAAIDEHFTTAQLEKDFEEIAKFYPNEYGNISELKRKSIRNMKASLQPFLQQFAGLTLKYKTLFEHAVASAELPEIKNPQLPFEVTKGSTVGANLGPFNLSGYFCTDQSLTAGVRSGRIGAWAEEFALIEFLLVNDLCRSVLITPPTGDVGKILEKCNFNEVIQFSDLEVVEDLKAGKSLLQLKAGAQKTLNYVSDLEMDAHSQGIIYSLVASDLFFRGFSTCLAELIETLKAHSRNKTSLFDNTVIQVASEFDRYPIARGSGSMHAMDSNPTSFFSGCLKGPQVLGNIYVGKVTDDVDEYNGTVGVGAKIKELNDFLRIENISSTTSTLLRAPTIVKRKPSLLQEKSGKIIALIEAAQNVEGWQ